MTRIQFAKLALAFSMAGVLLTGCGSGGGPPLGKVSGTITLDGEPLADAAVTFEPIGRGRPSSGYTDEEGNYTLEYNEGQLGAPLGEYVVKISTFRAGYDNGTVHPSEPEQVPAKYNVKAKANPDMTREVAAKRNTIDFELSSTAGEVIQPTDPLTAQRR